MIIIANYIKQLKGLTIQVLQPIQGGRASNLLISLITKNQLRYQKRQKMCPIIKWSCQIGSYDDGLICQTCIIEYKEQ